MPTLAEGTMQILQKYGGLIYKYCGSIPAEIVAARIWHETRGNPCPTPTACCDEQGLMQLWKSTRTKYGVTNACDPEQNIRAGCAHWNAEIANLRAKRPDLFPTLNADFWKIAYLYTAIGSGATPALLKAAGARPGTEYQDVRAFVDRGGEAFTSLRPSFGTQSADIVARRVRNADTYVTAAFSAGELAGGGIVSLALVGGAAYLGWKLVKMWRR